MNTDDLRQIARHAMQQRGLQADLPAAAHRQLDAIRHTSLERGSAIRDLRALPWCSIDNDDSRDLDQLSVSMPAEAGSPPGAARLLVAVADVDSLVQAGTPIDQHAAFNTTSVYTAAGVFPMLPERLSTDLTSLNEGQERLAIVVDMAVDAQGRVAPVGQLDGGQRGSEVYRAVVVNKAQLTYNAVAAWLDGQGPIPPKVAAVHGLDAQLRLQDRFASALEADRHAHGALSLETTENRPVFADGVLTDLLPDIGNRAKELISNFMIAANGVTARFLDAHGVASLRRMLRVPERWDRIVEVAAEHGGKLPNAPDAAALDAFLRSARDAAPARFGDLSLAIVKLLGRGEYALARPGRPSPGHFGLAVRDYTHSTAPNRRYPDLVTQRLIKATLAGDRVPYADDELNAIAQHCTEQEDAANKVERQVRKSAAALLLADKIGAVFDAIVTGASQKGTWVRIAHPNVEGRVLHGADGLDVGERTQVRLRGVDAQRGFIDFDRI